MAFSFSKRTLTFMVVTVAICLVILMFHSGNGYLIQQLRYAQPLDDIHVYTEGSSSGTLPPPVTDDTVMRQMLFDYIEKPNFCCKKLNMFGGVKIGTAIDGDKFICLDEGFAPPPSQCLIYSVGINNEWSFDKALINYGCEVYAFDPSMTNFKKNVTDFGAHFYRIGLGAKTEYLETKKWQMMTLRDIRAKLGHTGRVIDYLKVDIEGSEWDWLEQEPDALDKVAQLGMEIHMPAKHFDKAETMKRYYSMFQRMQQQGFRVIHTNPNRVRGRNLRVEGVPGKVTNLYELVWMKVI